MTTEQQIALNQLESLVNNRFSIETLTAKVREIFNDETINIEDISKEDEDVIVDYNLLFSCEKEDLYCYVDIYFLKMRNKGFDGSDMYITEIGCEFE
jgi:hypothetical protein